MFITRRRAIFNTVVAMATTRLIAFGVAMSRCVVVVVRTMLAAAPFVVMGTASVVFGALRVVAGSVVPVAMVTVLVATRIL